MNHSSTEADRFLFLIFFALQRADQISLNNICPSEELRQFMSHVLIGWGYSRWCEVYSATHLPCCFFMFLMSFSFSYLSFFVFLQFFFFPYFFTLNPLHINSIPPPPPQLSASDIASDQRHVLVIITAAVGGFTLLVILTLFLLITGR